MPRDTQFDLVVHTTTRNYPPVDRADALKKIAGGLSGPVVAKQLRVPYKCVGTTVYIGNETFNICQFDQPDAGDVLDGYGDQA